MHRVLNEKKAPVELFELPLNIVDALRLILLSFVLRKANRQRAALYFLSEEILLVQEQDEMNVGEPRTVADRIEQF